LLEPKLLIIKEIEKSLVVTGISGSPAGVRGGVDDSFV
jgi:hypothetical protein